MPAKPLNFQSFAGTRDRRCSPPHIPPGQFTRMRSQVRVLSRPPFNPFLFKARALPIAASTAVSVPKLFQNTSSSSCCSKSLIVFGGFPVEPWERLPHHDQLGLAVPLEDASVALPQHLSNEMVCDCTRAQPSCERMAPLVKRKIFTPARLSVAAQMFLRLA